MRRSLLLLVLVVAGCSGRVSPDAIVGDWEYDDGKGKIIYRYDPDGKFSYTVNGVRQFGKWRWLDGNKLEVEFEHHSVKASEIKVSQVTFLDKNTITVSGESGKPRTHRRINP